VQLEHTGTFAAGQTIKVKVTATSTGRDVKTEGVFIDLRGRGKSVIGQVAGNVVASASHSFKIADALTLAAAESRVFEGEVQVPVIDPGLDWEIRARLETFGNDPDSGFVDIV
jgi:1,4-dihydroxy-2-naphthoyl-CoA synthase